MEQGVQNSFITMGREGVYYKTPEREGIIRSSPVDMVSASGAGDAFVAGLVYGLCQQKSVEEEVMFAMGAALMAIGSEDTINPNISPESIETMIRNIRFTHQQL